MNERAFTLFTALVSFLLIGLAYLLIDSMILSERNTTDTISSIDEQAEMQSVADLARADAIQVFSFGVRYQMEIWLTDEENEFYQMEPENAQGSFQQMIDDFAAAEFGSDTITVNGELVQKNVKFANRMAEHLSNVLNKVTEYKGYEVTLESDKTTLREIVETIVATGVNEKKFLEPIKCEENKCEIGTFYINMDLTKLSDAEYEKLPLIVVKSQASGRTIKQPILPKGNIRIYIPLRVFKALHASKKIAEMSVFEQGSSIQKDLKEAGLGMCEATSSCGVRSNPFQAAFSTKIEGNLCPGDPRTILSGFVLQEQEVDSEFQVSSYNPSNASSTASALRQIVERKICDSVDREADTSIYYDSKDGLVLKQGDCAFAEDVVVDPTAVTTKTILADSEEGKAFCEKVQGIKVVLKYEETLEKYKVGSSSSPVYSIALKQDVYDSKNEPSSYGTCNSKCTPPSGAFETITECVEAVCEP